MRAAVLALATLASSAFAGAPEVAWRAPKVHLPGEPFVARVEITSPDGGDVPAWLFESAAFEADGKPVGKRDDDKVKLTRGARVVIDLDLDAALVDAKAGAKGAFKLAFAPTFSKGAAQEIAALEPVKSGVDWSATEKLAPADLARYGVFLRTNRGAMVVELWPDAAPKHVRNFLDLAQSGFYDGTLFHRVSPTFMIQGGDPNTKSSDRSQWGTGGGPRSLSPEFNAKRHERGVLSMARGDDPSSASCQFFVMTASTPALDGQYSAFGKLREGLDALDAIASAQGVMNPQDRTVQPAEPQRIEKAVVVKFGK